MTSRPVKPDPLTDPAALAKRDRRKLRDAVLVTGVLVIAIWAIKLTELAFGLSLHQVGLYPLRPSGLVGIITAPLIHGSIEHTVSNTLPLLLLGIALHYAYPKSRWWVLAMIWIGSGIGTWIWGRPSYHFGASGLTHGLMFFIFLAGVIRRDARSVVMAMLAFYLYGSMVWGIFPREPGISWEFHLFGAIMGVIAAVLFRHYDPKQPRRVYDYELEEDEEDEEDELAQAAEKPADSPTLH